MYTASAVDINPRCRWKQALALAKASCWASKAAHWPSHACSHRCRSRAEEGRQEQAGQHVEQSACSEGKITERKGCCCHEGTGGASCGCRCSRPICTTGSNCNARSQSCSWNVPCYKLRPFVLCSERGLLCCAVCLCFALCCSVLYSVLWWVCASMWATIFLSLSVTCMALETALQPFTCLATFHWRDALSKPDLPDQFVICLMLGMGVASACPGSSFRSSGTVAVIWKTPDQILRVSA